MCRSQKGRGDSEPGRSRRDDGIKVARTNSGLDHLVEGFEELRPGCSGSQRRRINESHRDSESDRGMAAANDSDVSGAQNRGVGTMASEQNPEKRRWIIGLCLAEICPAGDRSSSVVGQVGKLVGIAPLERARTTRAVAYASGDQRARRRLRTNRGRLDIAKTDLASAAWILRHVDARIRNSPCLRVGHARTLSAHAQTVHQSDDRHTARPEKPESASETTCPLHDQPYSTLL